MYLEVIFVNFEYHSIDIVYVSITISGQPYCNDFDIWRRFSNRIIREANVSIIGPGHNPHWYENWVYLLLGK